MSEIRRRKIRSYYVQLFTTTEGQEIIKELETHIEQEDAPLFNIRHCNEYMHYVSGKRAVLKRIKQLADPERMYNYEQPKTES